MERIEEIPRIILLKQQAITLILMSAKEKIERELAAIETLIMELEETFGAKNSATSIRRLI